MDLGRERLNWSADIWKRIDDAVHDEFQRTSVAAKFIPLYGPVGDVLTVPADDIDTDTMTISETQVTPLLEMWVEFGLTRQQVASEADLSTALTLATRAANILSQGEDLAIFRGDEGLKNNPLKQVKNRGGSAGPGVLNAAAQAIKVTPVSAGEKNYGERTFTAVAQGYSLLQNQGHYGPYALALKSELYADTFAPLPNTLAMPADRIKPLVTLGFFGAGALRPSTGILLSAGGESIDLVSGVNPITEFLQVSDDGLYRFRVFERFAVRIKDRNALVRLEFM